MHKDNRVKVRHKNFRDRLRKDKISISGNHLVTVHNVSPINLHPLVSFKDDASCFNIGIEMPYGNRHRV